MWFSIREAGKVHGGLDLSWCGSVIRKHFSHQKSTTRGENGNAGASGFTDSFWMSSALFSGPNLNQTFCFAFTQNSVCCGQRLFRTFFPAYKQIFPFSSCWPLFCLHNSLFDIRMSGKSRRDWSHTLMCQCVYANNIRLGHVAGRAQW